MEISKHHYKTNILSIHYQSDTTKNMLHYIFQKQTSKWISQKKIVFLKNQDFVLEFFDVK